MQSDFNSSSAASGKIQRGDVIEVIEGPRNEDPLEAQRVKGKAAKDLKPGWITLKDWEGKEHLERTPLLICTRIIAITSTFDIAEGKAFRKLDQGEGLDLLEEPKEDEVRGLTRVKARTKRDDMEGWVTMKGNKGASYVQESDKHYVVKSSTPLEKKFSTGSDALRVLEEGEIIEVSDGPKAETKEGPQRVRGRKLTDGTEGWFTLSGTNFQEWSPKYKCKQATIIDAALGLQESKTVRKLEAGEVVEALEAPVFDCESKLLRIRLRAEKDGAIGFATIQGNQGTVMLKPILDDAK